MIEDEKLFSFQKENFVYIIHKYKIICYFLFFIKKKKFSCSKKIIIINY